MNQEAKKSNPLLVPVILLAVCVVVLFVLLVTQRSGSAEPEPTQPAQTQEVSTDEPTVSPERDVVVAYDTDVCIPTAYVTLHLPEQWSDSIHVVQRKNGTAYTYTFYADLENREQISLFMVHFNEDGQMPLGTWRTESGEDVYLSLTPQELDFDDSWSSDEIDLVCAMQESSNYMLEVLSESPSFTPAN